ncbi:hypothetical protein ACA910_001708 [Epithemia clementina (nom. ined.)]
MATAFQSQAKPGRDDHGDAKVKTNGKSFAMPVNEFSRTVSPDRIRANFGAAARGRRRDYQMSISASVEECQALATRFDLKHIESLNAALVLRSESLSHVGGGLGNSKGGIEVEGNVIASVTQTCVRTNEDFEVPLSFPLYAIVRPVVPLVSSRSTNEDENNNRDSNRSSSKQQQRRANKSVSFRTSSILDDVDLLELQRMLQEDITLDDDDASLMEDETIYSQGGLIDVGELVSQLFWLNLDPYPKKPGTGPVKKTIIG